MLPWILFNVFIISMLALDLGVFHKKAHVVQAREAAAWSALWISLALLFGLGVYIFMGAQSGLEYITGYLIEKSLSVDNLFVIVLIFRMNKIPALYQHRVLFWGILGALVMRAIMILLGTSLIDTFHWMIYVFGLFLIYAGYSTLRNHMPGEEAAESPLMIWVKRQLPVTKDFHGQDFFVRENGKIFVTPLFVALLFVEFADLMFAIDSIPAILAITRDPFIVYTSNIFAILGLRSLYFLLAGVLDKFYYLHHSLSVILSFVGVKMLLVDIYPIPTVFSLGFIAAVFATAIVASVVRAKHN